MTNYYWSTNILYQNIIGIVPDFTKYKRVRRKRSKMNSSLVMLWNIISKYKGLFECFTQLTRLGRSRLYNISEVLEMLQNVPCRECQYITNKFFKCCLVERYTWVFKVYTSRANTENIAIFENGITELILHILLDYEVFYMHVMC